MALNMCAMWFNGIKIAFFSKNYKKSPNNWGFRSQTPRASVLGLERVCPRKGCPWPRIFFVSLALASSLVSSTPPLVIGDRLFAICRTANTILLWHWLESIRAQQFVEMLLQNKPRLVWYKKIRAMSFLPSVECGKFELKKAFQSGKIIACSKKSELCSTSTFKLIKMMLKCQVAQASSICMLY